MASKPETTFAYRWITNSCFGFNSDETRKYVTDVYYTRGANALLEPRFFLGKPVHGNAVPATNDLGASTPSDLGVWIPFEHWLTFCSEVNGADRERAIAMAKRPLGDIFIVGI